MSSAKMEFIEKVISDYVKSHHVYLSFKIHGRTSLNEMNQHNIFEKYCLQSPDVLSNSFRYNLEELKLRLDNFVIKTLDDLNEEHYLNIKDRIEEIFNENINKGFFNNNHVNFNELNDSELLEALEIFHSLVTDPDYVQLRDSSEILSYYSNNTIDHPAFQELLGYKFLDKQDFFNSAIIINNHINAIDMITNGDIPLYNGQFIDINEKINVNSLSNVEENPNYSEAPIIDDQDIS